MVTVVLLIHAYTRKPLHSVWIVPGSTRDFEDPVNEEVYDHITHYLSCAESRSFIEWRRIPRAGSPI